MSGSRNSLRQGGGWTGGEGAAGSDGVCHEEGWGRGGLLTVGSWVRAFSRARGGKNLLKNAQEERGA